MGSKSGYDRIGLEVLENVLKREFKIVNKELFSP